MEIVSVFGTQFTASTVIVFLGHMLEAKFPKLSQVAPAVKRTVYWLVAGASALGVHTAWNSTEGILTISGLTLAGLTHAGWHWLQSVALQEFVHGSTT